MATTPATEAFRQQYSSPPGGVSIGLLGQGFSGTLGCYLSSGNDRFLLSARHVLDPGLGGSAGLRVQQQSVEDGNVTRVAIAQTALFAALQPGQLNLANAAVAQMANSALDPRVLTGVDTYQALVAPCTVPVLGEEVWKSGRTTGRTVSMIKAVGVQVPMKMPDGKIYILGNCIAVAQSNGSFMASGDSGALLVNAMQQPVGLLFASNAGTAYATPINVVLDALSAVAPGREFRVVVG